MCTFGILVAALMALYVPNSGPDGFTVPVTDFSIAGYWRVMWAAPAVFAMVQSACMLLIFKYDSPKALK